MLYRVCDFVYIFLIYIMNSKSNAHAPYCRLGPARPYYIFPTLSHKWHDFRKGTLLNSKFGFSFSPQLCQKTFPIPRRNERDMIKNVHRSSREVSANSCPLSMKLEFPRTDFRKILKCQVSWKSVQWEPSCSMRRKGRTDARIRRS